VIVIVDRDKFKVEIDGREKVVNLIGADALKAGECVFDTSDRFLAHMLPVGSTVWLEKDKKNTDKKKRLLRYAWIPNPKGGAAELVNLRLVRYGYAGWLSKNGNSRYDDQFAAALGGVQNMRDLSDPDVAVWAVDNLENPTRVVTWDIMAGAFTESTDGASLDPTLTESAAGSNETLACAGYVPPPDDK
jgi:hypothetical protein